MALKIIWVGKTNLPSVAKCELFSSKIRQCRGPRIASASFCTSNSDPVGKDGGSQVELLLISNESSGTGGSRTSGTGDGGGEPSSSVA